MTTLEVENFANEDSLAVGASDVNLAVRLRMKVIPKFEVDVGHAAWRRKFTTLSISSGTRTYDLPTDFSDMLEMPIYDISGTQSIVHYIGENSLYVTAGDANTTPGTPDGYYLDRVTGPPTELRKISFNKIPSANATLRYGYLRVLRFTDYSTTVNLNSYIPEGLQWALVEGLKRELYIARFGIEDRRVADATSEYREYIERAIEYKEPGRRNHLKKVKQGPV